MKPKGFTLIELMLIVAILGIMAAVAIPRFADLIRKSKEGSTKGGLMNLRSALNIYFADNHELTPNLGGDGVVADNVGVSALVPKYIDAIPSVKPATYHSENNQIVSKSTELVNRGGIANLYDQGGWIYISTGGGDFFVDCVHTDIKNSWFTNW